MVKKFAFGVCAIALGAYSGTSAFLNGMQQIPGPIGYLLGGGLVAMLVYSGLRGLQASQAFANRAWFDGLGHTAHWAFSTAIVLIMSMGFVATHRVEQVGVRQQQIDGYQRAKANWDRTTAEIQAADAKGKVKLASALRQELRGYDAELKAGAPAESDATAKLLSWVSLSTIAPDTVAHAIPVWLAVAFDMAFIGCFTAASEKHRPRETPVRKRKAKRSPRRKANALRFPRLHNRKLSLVASNGNVR